MCTCTVAAKPECPSALLQWQHGKYDLYANGTIMLNPIEVDGRQIHSEPCKYESSIYTLYNMTEKYKVAWNPPALN